MSETVPKLNDVWPILEWVALGSMFIIYPFKEDKPCRVQQDLPSSKGTVSSEAGEGGGEGGRLAVSSAATDQAMEK